MSFGNYADIAINLVQQLMFVGFLNLFFESNKSKLKSVISFVSAVIVLFCVSSYFSFNYENERYIKIIIITLLLLVYSVVFLKGSIYLRVIVPVVIIGKNIALADLSISIIMRVLDTRFVNLVAFPDSFKLLYIIVSNIAFALLIYNLYYVIKIKIKLTDIPQLLVFVAMAFIIYISALCDLLIYEVSGFNEMLLPYVFIIAISVFALAGLYWSMLIKVSKDAELKTDLLLSTQREEMYKNYVLNTNEQIEKVSQVKHDMKNHIMSVNTLIANGDYKSAGKLCESVYEKLNVPSLSYCKNPVLNAVINVETEKASRCNIDFCYEVNYTLDFIDDSDIVSIVGNLCDNAIEYLSSIDESKRKMTLAVSSYKGYCYIVCKNTVEESVLSENPDLKTTKNDDVNHGKGVKILRDIAKKYGGEVLVKEQENELSISVIIRKEK